MKTILYEENVLRHNKRNCFPSQLDHYLSILESEIRDLFTLLGFFASLHCDDLLKSYFTSPSCSIQRKIPFSDRGFVVLNFFQARERKHLLEFLEDYDDDKDDPKYYK